MTANCSITVEKLRLENRRLRRKIAKIYLRRIWMKVVKYLKILIWAVIEVLAELFLDRRNKER